VTHYSTIFYQSPLNMTQVWQEFRLTVGYMITVRAAT